MKNIFFAALMLITVNSFAQHKSKAEFKKDGDLTIATYYHDNGVVSQKGTFNSEGELHGVWISYDTDGEKITVGNYVNGKKDGKWLFWMGNTLKEVDYKNSQIASVSEWTDKVKVAVN